ncbi:MarR family winged helix-turn-helix transcriptional regulator [Cellulomonas sp. C5510]|uniref:MarR family winged helix-turn-helix transcriptional regulator n=1 Tax=Cellulomonas sp. C5510 TaxID=2871170 RepID=UPI001C978C21|nr:MarR family transcriptional regulator [Cellulomonas sp. C5510]QZN87377.1 MarR family transcriptional regulator [Cellulomonas sp. C5510]
MQQPADDVRTIEAQVAMLLRLADRTRRAGARARGEIERSAYLVLSVLAAQGTASVNAIADALRLDPSTVTRQVLAMEQAGQVRRTADPGDGRVTLVAATDAGLAALATTRDVRARLYAEVLDGWPEDDRTELARLLTRLNADIDTWGRAHPVR